MKNPFNRNHATKEQRIEEKRRRLLIKDQLYPLLVSECENAQHMKSRVESTLQALKLSHAKKVNAFNDDLSKQKLREWFVQPLEGKGADIEQKVLDLLADEPMATVEVLLQNWLTAFDAFAMKDLLTRKPDTLLMELPE